MIKAKPVTFIVANNLPPVIDGVGHYSYNLYQQLKLNNINVKILTNRKSTGSIYLSNPDIIELGIDTWNWSGCWKLFKIVRNRKPKWLLIQYVPYSFSKNGFPLCITFYLILLRLSNTKILISFHEVSVRFFDDGLKSFFTAFLQRLLAYALCFISTRILTSNKYYASLLYPFKARIIPIPSNFEQLINTRIIKDDECNNRIVITSTANRCYETFFEIISLLTKENANEFVINITGRADKSDLSRIDNLTKKYNLNNTIICKVNLIEKEYCSILTCTDIFLHLEYVSAKGSGGVSAKSGVLSTAMAFGLPIVATCGDMTDKLIFKNKENLLFVPYDNPIKAANDIQILIKNISVRKELSKGARNTYITHVQWSKSIEYYLSVLN